MKPQASYFTTSCISLTCAMTASPGKLGFPQPAEPPGTAIAGLTHTKQRGGLHISSERLGQPEAIPGGGPLTNARRGVSAAQRARTESFGETAPWRLMSLNGEALQPARVPRPRLLQSTSR